jgi:hypothetical protein
MAVPFADFELIYRTDLVYVPDCWRLCGDAHCCSFSRYKERFKMIARTPFQELPLLPGEYEFLEAQGWLGQFGDFEHKVVEYALDAGVLRIESIVSRRPNCACDHGTRPTICRLYPLLPVFDVRGQFIGTESMGIYEELERIDKLAPACQLTNLPFDQLNGLLAITEQLSRNAICLFYLEAYRLTKGHVAERLAQRRAASKADAFALFELGFLRNNLIDHEELREQLNALTVNYRRHYGDAFVLDAASTSPY